MRAGGKRTWIKLYCYQRLHGSLNYQLTNEEQSVWDKLLCFTGLCAIEGTISDADGRPYPHSFIAHEIHASEELFESALDKCIEEGRITEDKQGIHITNWVAYQSEYKRQKPYREAKKVGKKIHKLCPGCTYKAVTDEIYCPQCAEKGNESLLERDYKGGPYGHMVRR